MSHRTLLRLTRTCVCSARRNRPQHLYCRHYRVADISAPYTDATEPLESSSSTEQLLPPLGRQLVPMHHNSDCGSNSTRTRRHSPFLSTDQQTRALQLRCLPPLQPRFWAVVESRKAQRCHAHKSARSLRRHTHALCTTSHHQWPTTSSAGQRLPLSSHGRERMPAPWYPYVGLRWCRQQCV